MILSTESSAGDGRPERKDSVGTWSYSKSTPWIYVSLLHRPLYPPLFCLYSTIFCDIIPLQCCKFFPLELQTAGMISLLLSIGKSFNYFPGTLNCSITHRNWILGTGGTGMWLCVLITYCLRGFSTSYSVMAIPNMKLPRTGTAA